MKMISANLYRRVEPPPVIFKRAVRVWFRDAAPIPVHISFVRAAERAKEARSGRNVSRAVVASGLLLLSMIAGASSAYAQAGSTGSLWREDASKPMFADKRAAGVGDVLTIVVQESTTASKDNKTATSKQSAVDASIATFLYSPGASSFLTKSGQMPALKYSAKNDFNGGGTINNNEKIVARVGVTVIDVLPNKNLVIEGKRETSFSGEQQTVTLRGIVRPEDVAANNTVFSYNISDSKIQITSKGTITDNQRKGWFTRIWEKITPF